MSGTNQTWPEILIFIGLMVAAIFVTIYVNYRAEQKKKKKDKE